MNMRNTLKKLVTFSVMLTLFAITTLDVVADSDRIVATDYEILENTIDLYFDVRECEFYDGYDVMTLGLKEVSNEDSPILEDEFDRKQAIEAFKERTGIRILDADVKTAVLSSAKIEETQALNSAITYSCVGETKDYYYMQVYEWTWISYDYFEAGTEDVMGYSTVHEIVLEKDGNIATIVSDAYEDGLLQNVVSSDYVVDYSDMVLNANVYDVDLTSVRSVGDYNVNATIAYADTYVVQDYLVNGNQITNYYNKNYPIYTSDCCNFVSQCLVAGGLEETDEWTSGSEKWKRVSKFVPYFTEILGYEDMAANSSNVFPGNPVYLSNETHIGICVGYNTAGVPILNAHTSDAYHIPLNAWGSTRTIQIVTSNLQSTKPADAKSLGNMSVNKEFSDTISGQIANYYTFTVSSTGFYDIYSTGNTDVVGYIFEESYENATNSNYDLYMYEIASDDDGGNGGNFSIYAYLEAGETYYMKIVTLDESISGSYAVYFEKAS